MDKTVINERNCYLYHPGYWGFKLGSFFCSVQKPVVQYRYHALSAVTCPYQSFFLFLGGARTFPSPNIQECISFSYQLFC